MPRKTLCPACRNPACTAATSAAGTCTPPSERRAGEDRRVAERRFFPRPEGRRKSIGRRVTDS